MTSADSETTTGPDAAELESDDLFEHLDETPQPDPAPNLVPRHRNRHAKIWVPIIVVVAILAAYCGSTLLWPIDAIAPKVTPVAVTPVPAAKAAMHWPAHGDGAVAVEQFAGTPTSTDTQLSMASITKVVTVLTVLHKLPLEPYESGPKYHFTAKDRTTYHHYLQRNESALDVPVGGSLTERQMLEGILIGSASNYANRLVHDTFKTNAAFLAAANDLLHRNGITGITIIEPTGFERGNKATPSSLMKLGSLALKNATLADIVDDKSVTLPGAGVVHNTNGIIGDTGVNGLKTGTLVGYDLLVSKQIEVGSTPVQLFAVSMYQPSERARNDVSRDLLDQLEKQLQVTPSVTRGTTVGEVRTKWGEKVPVVTKDDAGVVLWNGSSADVATKFALGDQRAKGQVVGSLTTTGPVDDATVDAVLGADIQPPSAAWRLTHPLELWGLQKPDTH